MFMTQAHEVFISIKRFDLCSDNGLKLHGKHSYFLHPWVGDGLFCVKALNQLLLSQSYFIQTYYAGWVLLVKNMLCDLYSHPDHYQV